VYESARSTLPTSPKAFLFATAPEIDDGSHPAQPRGVHDSTQDLESLNVLVDEISPERRLSARQELRNLARAFDSLSEEMPKRRVAAPGRRALTAGNRTPGSSLTKEPSRANWRAA